MFSFGILRITTAVPICILIFYQYVMPAEMNGPVWPPFAKSWFTVYATSFFDAYPRVTRNIGNISAGFAFRNNG